MILIVCAMEAEARSIKESLQKTEIFKITPQQYYYKGFLADKEVGLVVTGIGKVNAGALTSLVLAQEESVSHIINIGYAGGVKPFKLGDIVVIKDASYHDVDVTGGNSIYELGQVPEMPHPFLSDYELVRKLTRKLKSEATSLYTGDKFVYKRLFETSGVYDMEGAAIYQIAHIFNVPVVALKIVSDILDSKTQSEDFIKFEEKGYTLISEVLFKAIKD